MDACEATRRLVEYYSGSPMTHPTVDSLQKRISILQECLARMSDPPQSDAPAEKTFIDQTIDALERRVVSSGDRMRLRGSLDKADAPLTGRAGADEALGRITRLGIA